MQPQACIIESTKVTREVAKCNAYTSGGKKYDQGEDKFNLIFIATDKTRNLYRTKHQGDTLFARWYKDRAC